MQTETIAIDPTTPSEAALARGAETLRRGGLVAMPTETVYGLAANALDADAVARIFAAKGRPPSNPVIVHVLDLDAVAPLTTAIPAVARRLAGLFWPGPLTLVLPRSERVPDAVTAGGPTVAVRAPAHPVARGLLRAAGIPLAAPSANRSNALSPTRAEHVLLGLDGRIDLVLDAGPTSGGIESTVLDLTCDPPRMLRPGLVSPAAIEAAIGPIAREPVVSKGPARSPGMLEKHYAPRTPLELATDAAARVRDLAARGMRVGWVGCGSVPSSAAAVRTLPPDAKGYAAGLFAVLHDLDGLSLDRIIVEAPPEGDEWLGVQDRLARARHQG